MSHIHLKMAYQRFLIIFCVTNMVKVVPQCRVLASNWIREGYEQPFGLNHMFQHL